MIHGILNIYKEKGYTSHDVVAKLRGITGQRKIGHTGTLDPEAEGVLPVCLGRATKVCDLLTDRDKTYEAVLLLGIRTDTQDVTGTVTDRGDIQGITREMVEQAAKKYVGEYDQIPPMYSALKVNGKKLYELAREGKTIERKARRVRIYELEILEEASSQSPAAGPLFQGNLHPDPVRRYRRGPGLLRLYGGAPSDKCGAFCPGGSLQA